MIWTAALIVFIGQLLCCIYCERRLMKYLPTLAVGCIVAVCVLTGGWLIGSLAVWMCAASLLMGLVAIALYHLVLWTKNKR